MLQVSSRTSGMWFPVGHQSQEVASPELVSVFVPVPWASLGTMVGTSCGSTRDR